ncbi:restriction endonuclease subunit S [Acinetobacter pittii]|jgi:type I restriction enzyme S subunit|uniref:restriction endonuclease subunit S n=1 Tax=Acinetobacter pittii TaxID=48296 RepID=UPI0024DED5D3|nr:restriction endonuclease subunit S [Acinetobacter pittii]
MSKCQIKAKLIDLADYINGYAFNEGHWGHTGLPIVRIAQLTGTQPITDFYSGQIDLNYLIKHDEIIFCWSGTLLVTKWTGQEAWLNQHLFKVIPKRNIDRDFFYHLLRYSIAEIGKSAHGSAMVHITRAELAKFEVVFPEDIDIQRQIAKNLDLLDSTLSFTRTLIKKLQNKKQGLLNDLLTRGVDSHGNLRPSYEDAPDLYQETELGFVPKEWEICGLHDLQRCDKPVLKTGPFGSALKSEHWRESGHPVITIGSLGVNSIVESELLYIDDLTFSGLSSYLVEGGDIIFSRVADVGRCLIVQDHHKDWVMSSNLMRISVDNKIFKPELLTFILSSSSSLRKQIRKLVNSAGRDVANGEVLMKLKFAKPPVEEQVKIINIVERMNMAIDQELEQLNKLSNIKTGLLKDLLQN